MKQVKGEINTQKMKNAAVNATTAIADGVSSLLGGSKVKRLEAENESLRQDIVKLQKRVQSEQREQKNMEHRHNSEIIRIDRSYQQKIAGYDNRLKPDRYLFPYRNGTAAHSRTMPGSGVHRGTDKANRQPAARRVQAGSIRRNTRRSSGRSTQRQP